VQGAISLEHKAKQAVGGVQLVRLSFPPVCDVDLVSKIIGDTVASLYK
jgi:cysteine synthase A